MSKSNFVETETHTCNQIRYKVITELSIEKAMDELLNNNNPSNVKKIIMQPRNKIEEYTNYSGGMIENENIPWVKSKSWDEYNNRIVQCSNH